MSEDIAHLHNRGRGEIAWQKCCSVASQPPGSHNLPFSAFLSFFAHFSLRWTWCLWWRFGQLWRWHLQWPSVPYFTQDYGRSSFFVIIWLYIPFLFVVHINLMKHLKKGPYMYNMTKSEGLDLGPGLLEWHLSRGEQGWEGEYGQVGRRSQVILFMIWLWGRKSSHI